MQYSKLGQIIVLNIVIITSGDRVITVRKIQAADELALFTIEFICLPQLQLSEIKTPRSFSVSISGSSTSPR